MPNAFDENNPPFDRLTPEEIERVRRAVDIGYFRPGKSIIAEGAAAEALYVVIKGAVEERVGDETIALLGRKDCFDARALVQGESAHTFRAREETLCYILPRKAALGLIDDNPRFGAFFYLEISHKLAAIARDEEDRTAGATLRARVSEISLRPAAYIDAGETIETAGHRMREVSTDALFVRDGDRIGVITGINLLKAVILNRTPITAPVKPLTHFDVVSVAADDFVYAALILMTKTNKRRVAVRDGESYVGFLEDVELISSVTGNASWWRADDRPPRSATLRSPHARSAARCGCCAVRASRSRPSPRSSRT